MHTATMNHAIVDLLDILRQVEGVVGRKKGGIVQFARFLSFLRSPLAYADRRHAKKFDDLSGRLTNICLYFNSTVSRIRLGGMQEEIDPDFSVHDKLERAKDAIRDVHCKVVELQSQAQRDWPGGRTRRAIETLRGLAEEIYASANQLQWEIAEHDVDFSPRKSGYVANSPEESDQLLDKILSER